MTLKTQETETLRDWNSRYESGDTPWTIHDRLDEVIQLIQTCVPASASIAEIGCGHAKEAIALAKFGYPVSAFDISAHAIQQARENAKNANVVIDFHVADILKEKNFSTFGLVFDIAVLQGFSTLAYGKNFANALAQWIQSKGYWINVACVRGDVEKVAQDTGIQAPPSLSKEDLLATIDGQFSILQQLPTFYRIERNGKSARFPATISVLQKIN